MAHYRRRSASTALPGENLCRPIALPEDSPRSELSEPASQWLAAQATPPGRPARSSFGHSPLPLPTATLTQRPLIGGTLVCLYTHAGELLVVKQAGRGWVMEPIPATLQGKRHHAFLSNSFVASARYFGEVCRSLQCCRLKICQDLLQGDRAFHSSQLHPSSWLFETDSMLDSSPLGMLRPVCEQASKE